jgi:hypothetical protein
MRYFLTLVGMAFALAACSPDSTSTPTSADGDLRLSEADDGDDDDDSDDDDDDAPRRSRTYEVTIENRTTGQPFSPGVIATHTKRASFWRTGARASEGLRLIAEDGNESVALAELRATPGVFEVISTMAPIGRQGGPPALPTSRTFTIRAGGNANRLSIAVMLICTNDGFTGTSSVRLPGGFKARTYRVGAWDSGTEQNNEKWDQIVDPCGVIGPVAAAPDGNGRVATSDVVRVHGNIQGVGDLSPAAHGWRFPVAHITVRRID